MERYVGKDRNRIIWVTTTAVENSLQVPKDLADVSDKELIEDYRIIDGEFVSRNLNKEISELKIAFVGVWQIPCGISTYTEYLLPEIAKNIKEYKIFCEEDQSVEASDVVVPCWKRGDSLIKAASKIKEYKPDIVMIQHEYGIFPDARKWLAFLSQLSDERVFVTFHSVYNHEDKLICEAAAKNVIVHTEIAKEALILKGVTAPISVIPHGCLTSENKPRLWNLYRSSHTFMQFGFGFEYKGWETSIKTCAILKEKYPDVFFTGLFSESKFSKNLHDRYFTNLMELVEKLGISDNVALIRGFQSDKVLDSFFRINKCAIFPYRDNGVHTVFGVTGAARIAMKSGIPVVTSSVPFFYDLNGVCPKADTPELLAQEVAKAWQNPQAIVEKQNEFLEKTSWEKVALQYLKAFVS